MVSIHNILRRGPGQPLRLLMLALLLAVGPVWGQQFGQNKIGYAAFNFRLQQSRNFDLYHYLNNAAVRDHWLRQSEKWYHTHQPVLRDSIPFRNPLIFYANHADFQQTNVTPGPIDPATGGFAEALKNRIVMPVMHANAQTDHVLGHEVVHAMQFQMIRNNPDISMAGMFQLPLWVVEGMAEYMSIGPVDAHTALWMRDGVQRNALPTLEQLTLDPQRYFPYRWGHAVWAYITGTWGEQVVRPLFLEAARNGYPMAFQRVLGVTTAEFSRQWHQSLRAHYAVRPSLPELPGLLRRNVPTQMQLSPSLSPNGRYVALVSEKSGLALDVWLADARTGRMLRKMVSTTRNAHLDALSWLESAGTWSPDSRQFAFVAFAGGKNQLVITDVATGRIRQTLPLPGVPAFANPAWSPTGRYIAVNGLVDGQPDIFLYDFEEKRVRQLTNDRFSELQPSWSPDERMLTWATDQPAKQDDRPLAFDHRLVVHDLPTDVTRILDVFPGADNLNPVFGTDNRTIYFLSDRDGFRNLYAHTLYSDNVFQLTDFFVGITGLTPHAPALSIARETGQVALNVFEGGRYRLLRADHHDFLWRSIGKEKPERPMAVLPPFPRFNRDFVAARLNSTRPPDTTLTGPKQTATFQRRLRLIGINGGGGAGANVMNNRLGTSLNGGVTAAFGDLLNDKQLIGGLAVSGEITDVSGQLTYINRKRRVNWGLSLSHLPFRSGARSLGRDTLMTDDGRAVPVLAERTDVQRTFEQQLTAFAYLPLSRTRRIEVTASGARYSFRVDRTSDFFFRGQQVGSERERLASPPDLFTGQIGAAYVGDNTIMGPVGPLKGHRYRLGVEQTFGPVQLQTFNADWRQYLRVRPFTLAMRGMYVGRHGRDATGPFLPPLFVGFPTLVRGYSVDAFLRSFSPDNVQFSALQGSQMAVANAELRLSLSGAERQSIFRSRALPTELALFADAGTAWGRPQTLLPGDAPRPAGLERPEVVYSTGVSLRVNLLGFAVLEPFYAVPWRLGGFQNATFGLNIAAAW